MPNIRGAKSGNQIPSSAAPALIWRVLVSILGNFGQFWSFAVHRLVAGGTARTHRPEPVSSKSSGATADHQPSHRPEIVGSCVANMQRQDFECVYRPPPIPHLHPHPIIQHLNPFHLSISLLFPLSLSFLLSFLVSVFTTFAILHRLFLHLRFLLLHNAFLYHCLGRSLRGLHPCLSHPDRFQCR